MNHKLNNNGSIGITVFSTIGLSVLSLVLLIFSIWAFVGRQTYKNEYQAKLDQATSELRELVKAELQVEFDELEKKPSKLFSGSAEFGSIAFEYPKTWSVYSEVDSGGSIPLKYYFHPAVVKQDDGNSLYALRLEVSSRTFSSVASDYSDDASSGDSVVTAFSPANLPDQKGLKVTGLIDNEQQGQLVLLPLRNQTIKIWTNGSEFTNDFEKTVLASLKYIP